MPSKSTPKKSSKKTLGPKVPKGGVVYVTSQVHFNSAHRLYNTKYSLAWNQKQFGMCTNPHWHGHNYVLEVTVCGVPNPDTGYVIDLGKLKKILNTVIVDRVDHRNLNTEVAFLKGMIPSTENLTIAFWNELEPHIKDGKLYRVRLFETPRNFADYLGPV